MVFEGQDSTERSSHQAKQLNFVYLASLLLKWDISIIVHRFECINIIWWLGKEIAFGRASEWKRIEDYQWYSSKKALLWTRRRKYLTKGREKNYIQMPVTLEQGTLSEAARPVFNQKTVQYCWKEHSDHICCCISEDIKESKVHWGGCISMLHGFSGKVWWKIKS